MAGAQGRLVFEVGQVSFKLPYATYTESQLQLYPNQVRVVSDGETKLSLPLSCIRSIDIHQPIFGANYICGEYSEQATGSVISFTITFNKGGATDFARAFFRVTEGQLVSTEVPTEHTQMPAEPVDDKKTQ